MIEIISSVKGTSPAENINVDHVGNIAGLGVVRQGPMRLMRPQL